MSVIFRTTQSATKNTSSTSITITKPVGLAVDDTMTAVIISEASGITTPSGWTTIGSEFAYFSTSRYMKAFYKKADSGDVAATNFTFAYASSAANIGIMTAHTGAGILDVTNQGAVASGAASSSGVTPTSPFIDMFIIMVAGAGSGSESGPSTSAYAIATSNPSWTELADVSTNVGGGSGINLAMAWASRSQVTATGTVTATVTPASQTIIGSGIIIAGVIESRSVVITGTQLLLTGGTNLIKVGVKIAVTAAQILFTGGANLIKKTLNWTNQSKSSASTWSNQNKSDV